MIKYLNDYIIFFEQNKEEPTPPTPTQPDNEIWYYANSKASLYKTTNVIEHTFADGKGVLKFANALTSTVNWFDSTNITGVSLPNTITSLGGYSFYNCYSLNTINIPSGLISIGKEAFINCWSISRLSFPESLTSVSTNILKDSGVKTIMFNGKPASIASTAFNRSSVADIYVPWSEGEVANAPWGANYAATIHYNSVVDTKIKYKSSEQVTLYSSEGVIDHSYNDGVGILTFDNDVSTFKNWFRDTPITDIYFPSTLSSIECGAFYDCVSLSSIQTNKIPNAITNINDETFYNCSSLVLTSLNNVKNIGKSAFYGCSKINGNLYNVTSIGPSAFYGCTNFDNTTGVTYLSLSAIEDYAFYGCRRLDLSSIGSPLSIGNKSFYGCNSIFFNIPKSVASIGDEAFGRTLNFSYTFNGKPASIASTAFNRSSVADIYVPWSEGEVANAPWGANNATIHYDSVPVGEVWYYAPEKVELFTSTGIKEHNFENGKGVLVLQGELNSTEQWFCEVDSITSVKLPKHIKYITDESFLDCTSLLHVELPSNLESIMYSAFNGCENLSLTSLPDSVTSIGDEAFLGCSNLLLTSLPNSLTSIGENAFASCSLISLTSLPDGLTRIEAGTFNGCSNIALTSLPTEITYIGDGAFMSCSNLALTSLPDGITVIEASTFTECTSLALTSLPDGVTAIGDEAFYDCANISMTTLPAEVTYIGDGAFGYCGQINITELPASVTNVGNYAFEGCGMRTLRFNGTPSNISDIAFMEMNDLEHLYVPWSEGEVENAPWGVDESVTTIHYNS